MAVVDSPTWEEVFDEALLRLTKLDERGGRALSTLAETDPWWAETVQKTGQLIEQAYEKSDPVFFIVCMVVLSQWKEQALQHIAGSGDG